MFLAMWAQYMIAESMLRNARDTTGSNDGQQTMQGTCVLKRAVQDRGGQLY